MGGPFLRGGIKIKKKETEAKKGGGRKKKNKKRGDQKIKKGGLRQNKILDTKEAPQTEGMGGHKKGEIKKKKRPKNRGGKEGEVKNKPSPTKRHPLP